MPFIQFIVVLVIVGVVLWLVNTYIPMSSAIKKLINIVVVIAAVIFSLNAFGLLDSVKGLRIG